MTRSCSVCGKQITKYATTGKCHACANADPAVRARKGPKTPEDRAACGERARRLLADPEINARRLAASKAAAQRPEAREKHRAGCVASMAKRKADPIAAQQLRDSARRMNEATKDTRNDPVIAAKRAKAIRAARLPWCPERYWDLNRDLKSQKLLLDQRKRIIADLVAKDERKRVAALTPEQRQMERLIKAGGKLREVRPIARAQHDFTLGGVASGLL